MADVNNRALVILAAYDFESLQLTLQSLEHTISQEEKVVLVLNGKRTLPGERVERVARNWASAKPAKRFVVKPLSAGSPPYIALTEVLRNFEPLKLVDYICKIDDDLIPLNAGWMDRLAENYEQLAKEKKMSFLSGLINNNSWGFKELVDVFGKYHEYEQIMNYPSIAGHYGEQAVAAGEIDAGIDGTIWQYPYLAWWAHQWTSNNIAEYISKTATLGLKRIPDEIHYSIGCIYFEKDFWLSINHKHYGTRFDELLIHLKGNETKREKWALMNEPMIHMFYRSQRSANHDLIELLQSSLSAHFKDEVFYNIERMLPLHFALLTDAHLKEIDNHTRYVHRKVGSLSIGKNWNIKAKIRKFLGR
ncbi:MAG: hypothetical protein JWQ96_2958 [Segetibacter sp.]|nr:hypothetical protein [Segetibacter sp.]